MVPRTAATENFARRMPKWAKAAASRSRSWTAVATHSTDAGKNSERGGSSRGVPWDLLARLFLFQPHDVRLHAGENRACSLRATATMVRAQRRR